MNSVLLLFGLLMALTPITIIAAMDNITDLPMRFSMQQMGTLRGLLFSGVTFMVIALVMIWWI